MRGMKIGYKVLPFSVNRRMAAASAAVASERSTIHGITEADIGEPRRLMEEHRERTGEALSLTAYVVACLARAVSEAPELNSFRKGRRLVMLDDVTVSVLVERELDGEKVPEPVGIQAAQTKSYRQIHDRIRLAQHGGGDRLGSLSGSEWIRFIPSFLFRAFIRAASRSVRMAKRYGVVSVTAVGMFGSDALWFLPLGGATVLVTVGSIVKRPRLRDGRLEEREHLCLTISFDHEIVDGAPAARFVRKLTALIESGAIVRESLGVK
jgi:pyruvate/2-oxoglutarate dehydrogenase complex dihydrolipoamide acyltransferase (E2) component